MGVFRIDVATRKNYPVRHAITRLHEVAFKFFIQDLDFHQPFAGGGPDPSWNQRDAMSHSTFALLVEYGDALTRESYLNVNNVDEDDLDAEQKIGLPDLFQEPMIEERVASVMFEIEIDDTVRQLSEGVG
jgi:hypothetical protein